VGGEDCKREEAKAETQERACVIHPSLSGEELHGTDRRSTELFWTRRRRWAATQTFQGGQDCALGPLSGFLHASKLELERPLTFLILWWSETSPRVNGKMAAQIQRRDCLFGCVFRIANIYFASPTCAKSCV
jgi:hypothetical protein